MNKTLKSISRILIVVGICALALNKRVTRTIDDIVLLENRASGYCEYLSNAHSYYVSKIALQSSNDNRIVNTIGTVNYSNYGFRITTHSDGSFTFSGTYEGSAPLFIYPMDVGDLPSGDYILTDGGASCEGGIQLRIYGINNSPDGKAKYGNCVTLPGDGAFDWDRNEYEKVKIAVVIYPGYSAEGNRFFPMLCKKSKMNIDSYQPAIQKLDRIPYNQNADDFVTYTHVKMSKENMSEWTVDDWRLIQNNIKYTKNTGWTTFDFNDGTGLVISSNNSYRAVYGEIDPLGRILKPLTDDMHLIK